MNIYMYYVYLYLFLIIIHFIRKTCTFKQVSQWYQCNANNHADIAQEL